METTKYGIIWSKNVHFVTTVPLTRMGVLYLCVQSFLSFFRGDPLGPPIKRWDHLKRKFWKKIQFVSLLYKLGCTKIEIVSCVTLKMGGSIVFNMKICTFAVGVGGGGLFQKIMPSD